MKKLRLVVFEECNRECTGCCNKDWDLKGLPVCDDYSNYEKVFITGGEPMLKPNLIIKIIKTIRKQADAKIILYTAKSRRAFDLIAMLHILDGITLTLHEPYDVASFIELNTLLLNMGIKGKELRLNIFKNVNESKEFLVMANIDLSLWEVVDNKEWIKDCPLPRGEEIKRLDWTGQ